ncbi:hypothetical protein [Methylocucumis oryzae]|uniref:PilZ domain-containing protein n=1 Tax=Methylocucumis oryzae TaxID=1632867 RepID=A0A0F3IL51_9GAMM|nr:hypothetical protein [Methylocucumis oryzae]KJV06284.1 hypothetical protein VZ94_12155 [Methylocucumis oryzae]
MQKTLLTVLASQCEYTGRLDIITLTGAFLTYAKNLMPDSLAELDEIRVCLEGKWLPIRCEIVYAATENDGIFPFGFGVIFKDDEATQWAIAKLLTTSLLSEMASPPHLQKHAAYGNEFTHLTELLCQP